MGDFDPVSIICAKRDGEVLNPDAVKAMVDAYTQGRIADYQMSAFLMAVYLKGLDANESAALTQSMLHSGKVLDLADISGIKVDKHSTGGVGDKISIVLAPLVAACGVPVPMISGRGLGHSGGTLDKLESIPGFRTNLTLDEYRAQLERIGVVMIGQTEDIAPADRKIYALRDVTGTVESIPLIAASIMSKKLAEGIDALVLDVKCGRGAFMQTEPDARRLAESLVEIGEQFGKPTVAWLTDMEAPLGYGIGNWPEVAESIACLRGEPIPEVSELTCRLAGEMLYLGGRAETPEAGRKTAEAALVSGAAFEKFRELVAAQGGDLASVEHPESRPGIEVAADVYAFSGTTGYVAAIDARKLGYVVRDLGAGRMQKEDEVDPTAGIVLNKKPGDAVQPGDLLAQIYTQKSARLPVFQTAVRDAFHFTVDPPAPRPLLLDRYTKQGWQYNT